MQTLLLTIHLLVCFVLVFVVLIQSSKGAQMGAAFGGSSQTVFGTRGAATFLSKMTTVMAVIFMVSSLLLAVIEVRSPSVVDVDTMPVGKPFQEDNFKTQGVIGTESNEGNKDQPEIIGEETVPATSSTDSNDDVIFGTNPAESNAPSIEDTAKGNETSSTPATTNSTQ